MSSLSSRWSTTTLKIKFVNVKTLSYLFTTVCGGCKVGFKHPFHYRLHCTIFHDPQCPMKGRKNYCKDIVEPTSIAHEGKGAYQCQYYKMVTTNTKTKRCKFHWRGKNQESSRSNFIKTQYFHQKTSLNVPELLLTKIKSCKICLKLKNVLKNSRFPLNRNSLRLSESTWMYFLYLLRMYEVPFLVE